MEVSLQDLVQEWLRVDQNQITRNEIETLSTQANTDELERRLRKRIAFGTAGLRARMGAGFAFMNDLTVIQASQGFAAYLLSQESCVESRGVVIGHDARFNSRRFAELTAAAFMAKNISVKWLGMVHTPMVPYTVGKLGAAGGIMITASHNPALDNGYKVYWSNGCQIIPPHDSGIADAILKNLEPATWDTSVVTLANPLMVDAQSAVLEQYMAAVASLTQSCALKSAPSFVYTPMHGVGLPFLTTAIRGLGLEANMHVVPAQAQPDPTFPSVEFPNPEEKGALDLAKESADAEGLSLILANDPDADRFAVAEKVNGVWRQLSGNQLGVLLASHVLETYKRPEFSKGLAMLASTVSSRMLSRMSENGKAFHFEETLTGFKWLGNRARDLQAAGYDALYAYEEALGYMFTKAVFDKDGVAAASVFLAACARWKTKGLTPWTQYETLCEKYGYFEDANTYLVSPSPDVTNRIFEAIRARQPDHVGARNILRLRDLTIGFDSGTPDHKPTLPVDKTSQMISCELEGGVTFTVRGSGTEPKIKLYVEGTADSYEKAKHLAVAVVEDLVREWFRPEENGLRLA